MFPGELFFGALVVGEDQIIRSFIGTNNGSRTIRIESMTIQQDGDQFLLLGSPPEILRPGESFEIGVKYQSNQLGLATAVVAIETSEDKTYFVRLSGRVIGSLHIEQMWEGFRALVQQEAFARADADSAEAGLRTLLQATLENSFSSQILEERLARVTALEAEATTRFNLAVSLNDLITATNELERNARIAGDQAEASTREALEAELLLLMDSKDEALGLSLSTLVQNARVAAELAQTSAELAAELASTYRDESIAQATAAQGYATLANTAKSEAESWSNLAAGFSEDAAADAATAGNYAEAADTSKVAANNAKVSAESAATLSATYRDQALGHSNTASGHASAANTSKVDASAAKVAAESARDLAVGYKNDAATSATNSQTSKVGADNAKAAAEDARNLSATYRDQSQGYRNEAEGFKNTASTQAGIATTARVDAQAAQAAAETSETLTARIIANQIPFDFQEEGRFFSSNYNGLPADNASIATNSVFTFPVIAGYGKVLQINSNSQTDVANKGAISLIAGRKYRITGEARRTNGSALIVDLYSIGLVADGSTSVGNSASGSSLTLTNVNQWYSFSREVTADSLLAAGAAYLRALFRKRAGTSTLVQFAFIKIEDITEVKDLEATVSVQAGAIAQAQGDADDALAKLVAYWQVTAVSGGRAKLRVYADSNGGGGVDIEGDVRISGNLIVDGTIVNSKLPNTVIDQPKLANSGKGQSTIRNPFGPASPYFFGDSAGGEQLLDSFNLVVSYPVWVLVSIGMTYEHVSGSFTSATDAKAWVKIWNNNSNSLHESGDQMKWANSSPGSEVGSGNSNSRVDFFSLPAGNWDIRMAYANMNNNGRFFAGWNNFDILWGPA